MRKFIERINSETATSTNATTTSSIEAEARLKVAEETIAEGKVKLEAKAYGEALALSQKAHRIAQEAKLLLQANKELKVEVKFNGNGSENNGNGVSGKVKIGIGL